MGGDIYMLLIRDRDLDIPRWRSIEYCSRAKDAFDIIKSGNIIHKCGDLFTIISVDYTSDITEKARFLWVSDGKKIMHAPQTHIFMGDKTWLQFWEGIDSTAENMFSACSVIDRKIISRASCECIKIALSFMSGRNLKWAKDSIECILSGGDVDRLISQGNEIMIDVAFPEYEAVYSVIKSLHTVNSMSPHYEAHVAVTNAASASGKQEEAYREMAAIIREHIPLHRLILDTANSV